MKRFLPPSIKLLLGVMILSFVVPIAASPHDPLYGGIDELNYLTGRFHPEKEKLFVELSSIGIATGGRKEYLRRDTAEALKNLLDKMKREKPDLYRMFRVVSSTRTYHVQRYIWQTKWEGKTLVEGHSLNKSIPDYKKRALKILEFSSMPGTSRHHWGTDFDMNELYNDYYNKNQKGGALYEWFVQYAPEFGFCQPYTADRTGGYKEERWHWSYRPVSSKLTKDWMKHYQKSSAFFVATNPISSSDLIAPFALEYVQSISAKCLE